VFFMAQLWVASEQNRRSQALANETTQVLGRIDEKLTGTVDVIKQQFGFVLRHALQSVPADALPPDDADSHSEDGPDDDERSSPEAGDDHGAIATVEAKLDAMARSLNALTSQRGVLQEWDAVSRTPAQEPRGQEDEAFRAVRDLLGSWPDEKEGAEVAAAVEGLPEPAKSEFRRLGRLSRFHLRKGRRPPQVFSARSSVEDLRPIEKAGLAKIELRRDAAGEIRHVLRPTLKGLAGIRLITATGMVPEWYRAYVENGSSAGEKTPSPDPPSSAE
jgi:hypothetical protein